MEAHERSDDGCGRAAILLRPESPLSPRAAQWRSAWWQQQAGFDRRYNFHAPCHSAVTNLYRATKNLFPAQRFARHASPPTTIIYIHPAEEELAEGVKDLLC